MISKKEEGKLSLINHVQLWYHLFICSLCKLFYQQNTLIIKNATHLHKYIDVNLSPEQKKEMIALMEIEK